MPSQWVRTVSIQRVDRIMRLIAVDPRFGPFPAKSIVSPALHESALRRLAEVQLALRIVVDDPEVFVVRPDESERWIEIRERGLSGWFGLWVEVTPPEPDEPTQLERDVEVIVDDLSETRAFWGRRLPECPQHPDSHPLLVAIGAEAAMMRCPASGDVVRTVRL